MHACTELWRLICVFGASTPSVCACLASRSSAIALFVALECDIPGTFSDNAFLLLPWEPKAVTFTGRAPFQLPDLGQAISVVSLGNMWRQ